jgi:hypothetical protein
MAVYAEDLRRRKSGGWKAVAESLTGFALRFILLLVVAGALFAALAAASLVQSHWQVPAEDNPIMIPAAPAEDNPIMIPAPWTGQDTA